MLATRVSLLAAIAAEASLPPVRDEGWRLQTNVPQVANIRRAAGGEGAAPLRHPLRRPVGAPFYVNRHGQRPPASAAAAEGGPPWHCESALTPPGPRWTTEADDALVAAVTRVARARGVHAALQRQGLTLPRRLQSLGSLALPSLPDCGPRAEAQYSAAPHYADEMWLELQELRPAARLGCVAEMAAACTAPPGPASEHLTPDDWIRIAHGGFLPSALAATPADARCRWHGVLRPAVRTRWSKEEDDALCAAVAAHGGRDWEAIAAAAGGGRRTPSDCFLRFRSALDVADGAGAPPPPWTPAEDATLRSLVAQYGATEWQFVAMLHGSRSPDELARRWAVLTAAAHRNEGDITLREELRMHMLVRPYIQLLLLPRFTQYHADVITPHHPPRAGPHARQGGGLV